MNTFWPGAQMKIAQLSWLMRAPRYVPGVILFLLVQRSPSPRRRWDRFVRVRSALGILKEDETFVFLLV